MILSRLIHGSNFNLYSIKFKKIYNLFSRNDKQKLLASSLIQLTLSVLDLVGVAIVGVIGALSINGIQSRGPGTRTMNVIGWLHLENSSFHIQILFLGVIATSFFLLRTFLSIYFGRRVLKFLSSRSAEISSTLISKVFNLDYEQIRELSTQDLNYRLTSGVSAMMLGIFGTLITISSDFALLLVMSAGLFYVDPFTAISTFIFFSLVAFTLYKKLNIRARFLGRLEYEYSVKTNEKISELMGAYRELTVRNRRSYYIDLLSNLRREATSNTAEIAFLPNFSKYIMEAAVIVGFLLIAASQFLATDNSRAVPTVVIFLTAGTRIAPAILRLQQGAVSIRQAAGTASGALSLVDFLAENPAHSVATKFEDPILGGNSEFRPCVSIENLSYTFPNENSPIFSNLSLNIDVGQTVAIVGPSGAGKTTLVDLLIGVRHPDSGKILISGIEPAEAISNWPGAMAYVPQDVSIFAGSLKENIGLGYSNNEIESGAVEFALDRSMLRETVGNLAEGADTLLGERGTRLSGGQRQRLGIARALFTKPKLIIFDEATSSLDGVTELNVTKQIYDLGKDATLILIAHRLSTVRDADLVIYLADGQIVASGSFEDVRKAVPDFATQAKLMGL